MSIKDKVLRKIEIGELLKRLKAENDKLKEVIAKHMGAKENITNEADGYSVSLKASERVTFDAKAFRVDNPELADRYSETSIVVTMRCKLIPIAL